MNQKTRHFYSFGPFRLDARECLLNLDGKPVPPKKRQWYDTYQVGYWDGVSKRYPSVTLRMDFRGNIDGESVYQCEILGHEEVQHLLDTLTKTAPKLVEDLVPRVLAAAAN